MAYQARHRQRGICILCPQEVSQYKSSTGDVRYYQYCDEHRAKQKARRDSKLASAGVVRRTRCSACGKPDHNRQTCTDKAAVEATKHRKRKSTKRYKCPSCGELGHSVRTCPTGKDAYDLLKSRVSISDNSNKSTCEKCGKAGCAEGRCPAEADKLMEQLQSIHQGSMAAGKETPDKFYLSGLGHNHRMAGVLVSQLEILGVNGAVSDSKLKRARKLVEDIQTTYESFSKVVGG
jgi:hypothetical protein